MIDSAAAVAAAGRAWDGDILPALREYVRIPNVSPAFAPAWREDGHMAAAAALVRDWCASRSIPGLEVDVIELPGRTPVVLVDVPATGGPAGRGPAGGGPVLLYGHLDKQPPMTGWREGLGPWEPVVDGDRLYGRGAADDGYAAFAALSAIEAVHAAGGAHARCVVLIEASEESGSPDLPAYMDALGDRIGTPSLVICLDSGCATYDRLWVTTSLRGLVSVVLTVEILTEGIHSGIAGGVVPSSFRILRQLLSRIEDERDGELLLPELFVEIPADRVAEAHEAAAEIDAEVAAFPLVPGATAVGATAAERVLNRTWRPALATVGIDGIPSTVDGGNVLRPFTRARLSVRLPPTCDVARARAALLDVLTRDPPHGARVTAVCDQTGPGWNAPSTAPWLAASLDAAGEAAFGQPARAMGEGGSIPFMGMLGERFPEAQFVVTGVVGPGANAHGPNEFLHLPTARKITAAVAHLLDAHTRR